jgi:hypothetical protein
MTTPGMPDILAPLPGGTGGGTQTPTGTPPGVTGTPTSVPTGVTPVGGGPIPQGPPVPITGGTGGTTGGGTPTGTGNPAGDLTGDQRDAYSFLVDEFDQFGLGTLAPTIFNYIKQGYGADTITLLLQDTPEYKQRFAGNELRAKAGLGVLSPAQYLSTESSYRAILANAGLPKSFYDQPSDFAAWIGGDVSPTEIQNRVNLEQQTVAQAPNEVKQALTDLYGVSEGDMVAYFLDQSKAVPLLQLQAQAAQIGGQALMRGLSDANAGRLAELGISTAQATTGYSQIGESLNTLQQIAQRFGTNFSQTEAENAIFNPNAVVNGENATRKQGSLIDQEKALFSGNTGAVSYIGLNAGSQQQ